VIKIYYYSRIPKWVLVIHTTFASWLTDNFTLDHTIKIHLSYVISFATANKHQRALGFFNPNKSKPYIGLACRIPKLSRDQQIPLLLETFAHEFCHYEQFRDGKPRNHRGVENRAYSLVNRFHQYVRSLQ
jgi:hypothetical protein